MATLLIRRLDDAVKQRLRMRAAEHGRSMEDEAREILTEGLRAQHPADDRLPGERWFEWAHRVYAPLGGLPDPPPRLIEPYRDPFEE